MSIFEFQRSYERISPQQKIKKNKHVIGVTNQGWVVPSAKQSKQVQNVFIYFIFIK